MVSCGAPLHNIRFKHIHGLSTDHNVQNSNVNIEVQMCEQMQNIIGQKLDIHPSM